MKKVMFYSMTLQSGGAERVISNLANELVADNKVAIATLINSRIDYDLNQNINIIPSSNNEKMSIFNRIKNMFKLLKNTKKYNPDTIIAFCPTMCFIACFFKMFSRKFKKINLIISERNDPKNEYKSKFLKKLANFLYSKANTVVFQTTDAMNFFDQKVKKKGIIIPNPINNKFLDYNFKGKKENCIVNVGRLEPQKNQKLLIKACKDVFEKHPDWKLKIYGEGNLKDELIELIEKLNIKKNVMLMGRCSELEKELPKNKLFVLSSDFEGMPNALMEAMASGLACISTDCPCGGSKDLIKHGENGLLVETNNVTELTDTICELIENQDLFKKIVLNSNKNLDKYSNSTIIQKWMNII